LRARGRVGRDQATAAGRRAWPRARCLCLERSVSLPG